MSWDFWGDQSKKTASYTASRIGGAEPDDPTEIQDENTSSIFSGGSISSNGQQCFDSQECGSGWACVGGRCVFLSGAVQGSKNTESGTTAGCGSGPDGSGSGSGGGGGGGGGGGCAAGTGNGGGRNGGGCTKTGAGDCGGSGSGGGGGGGGGGDDCCGGVRCCRQGGCSCGPCPPPNNCSQFCAAQKSSTGDSGPGCRPGNECDECSACQQEDETGEYKCLPRDGGPCYCPGGTVCSGCTSCDERGSCVDDASRCLDCCNCFLECPCGVRVERRICIPHVKTGVTCPTICRAGLNCDAACPPPPDPVPEPCDCNCENDCGDCEICNAAGECVPDPDCDRDIITSWEIPQATYPYKTFTCACLDPSCSSCGPGPGSENAVEYPGRIYSGCGPAPHSLRYTGETIFVVDCENCASYGTRSNTWELVDGNGSVIAFIAGAGVSGSAAQWTGKDPAGDVPVLINTEYC